MKVKIKELDNKAWACSCLLSLGLQDKDVLTNGNYLRYQELRNQIVRELFARYDNLRQIKIKDNHFGSRIVEINNDYFSVSVFDSDKTVFKSLLIELDIKEKDLTDILDTLQVHRALPSNEEEFLR